MSIPIKQTFTTPAVASKKLLYIYISSQGSINILLSPLETIFVTGFGKTDHIVTIDISRNTDLKYRSHHGSLVLDCSHARFAV